MPNSDCPVCRTADIVCGKWTMLVIRDLAESRRRFCELERSLEGISPRTLSLRLRALEEEGIVARETFPEVPPRVEYALTAKGRALVPIVESMRAYGTDVAGRRRARAPSRPSAVVGRRSRRSTPVRTASTRACGRSGGARRGTRGACTTARSTTRSPPLSRRPRGSSPRRSPAAPRSPSS